MRKFYVLFILSLLVGRTGAQAPVSYCVENDITHAYLNDFSYDTVALEISYVMDYFNMPHDYRLDAPRPVRLSWTHQDGAEAQELEVYEYGVSGNPLIFTIDKDTAQYDLYNMIPGVKYQYKVVSIIADVRTTVSEGVLEPTGMLRWILGQGTWNVRDMGGWPGLGGHPIKYGMIFRGAQLKGKGSTANLVTAAGIEAMRNTGIRAELDLRSKDQAPSSVSALAVKDSTGNYDVDYLLVPESSGARMCNFDKTDVTIRELQWIIDELKAGKPVYYHCQNGADRTGTMGFLIGALLGMNESDLAKDYELTTFCEAAAAAYDPTEKGFARLRNYEGKKGSPIGSGDNADEYKYAKLVEKMRTVTPTDGSYQRKIYNWFLNGKSGTKISEADLDWFIKEMVDYVLVKEITYEGSTGVKLNPGETFNLNASVLPADATAQKITYKSSDEAVATVSEEGVITAVRGSQKTAQITISCDGLVKTVKVTVPPIESELPEYAVYQGVPYYIMADQLYSVTNGSFEYADPFYNWKDPQKAELSAANFDVKHYESGDSVYIQSKFDGDETSVASIYGEWNIGKNKTFVFGYRVRNTSNIASVENPNLKVMLTTRRATDNSGATVLEFPSYDGNWTEVRYVFNSESNNQLRILFTHLSQDGNHTCFDNFFLAEIDLTKVGIAPILKPIDGTLYDLNGRPADENARGILIKNGKKVLIR